MNRYVLVHGSWHGAWCWDKVIPLLKAAGQAFEVLELPGHGKDDTDPEKCSLPLYVDGVVEALDAGSAASILVGHSFGGMVISQAAEAPCR